MYDSEHANSLEFGDFLRIVLPKENSELRFQVVQRTNREVDRSQHLESDISNVLATLLNEEVESMRGFERLRSRLVTRFDFSPLEAFRLVDKQRRGAIDFESLAEFFTDKGARAEPADVAAVVRRLDRDGDCKVSYLEFLEGVVPFQHRTKTKPAYTVLTKACLDKLNPCCLPGSAVPPVPRLVADHDEDETGEEEKGKQTGKNGAAKRAKVGDVRTGMEIITSRREEQQLMTDQKLAPLIALMVKQAETECKLDSMRQQLALQEDISMKSLQALLDGAANPALSWLCRAKNLGVRDEIAGKLEAALRARGADETLEACFMPSQEQYAKLMFVRDKTVGNVESKKSVEMVKSLLLAYVAADEADRTAKAKFGEGKTSPKELFGVLDTGVKGYFCAADVSLQVENVL